MPLKYHAGQIELQTEANTLPVAEMLADWVGPVVDFLQSADIIVIATPGEDGRLSFSALSGLAPIGEVAGPSSVLLRLDGTQAGLSPDREISCGGLAISLAVARRARLNGTLGLTPEGLLLTASEAFTNCRKYIAPSAALADARHFGPEDREPVDLGDPWVGDVLARAETAFLATVSPDGIVDVSHRGGPPGYLLLTPADARLEWDEFVGDGMFKSAGNIRATGTTALVVPDLATGDAVELAGRAQFTLLRREKKPRLDSLLQGKEEHPVQGRVTCTVEAAYRLRRFIHPRQRLEKRLRVTSASATSVQHPQ